MRCSSGWLAIHYVNSKYYQSEYIADCDSRRAFISGFTGSAGFAIVTLDRAALWTDGRYFLQASKQLDSNWVLMKQGQTGKLRYFSYCVLQLMIQVHLKRRNGSYRYVLCVNYLKLNGENQSFSKSSSRLGMDPRLVTVEQADKWKTFLEKVSYGMLPL